MSVVEKVKEVRLIGEDGKCLATITPEEYFFEVKKIGWFERIFTKLFQKG